MRNRALTFVPAALLWLTLGSWVALAAPAPAADVRTARAETGAPVPVPVGSQPAAGVDELRDCAALVLVGGMLIGLAAAVRRTA